MTILMSSLDPIALDAAQEYLEMQAELVASVKRRVHRADWRLARDLENEVLSKALKQVNGDSLSLALALRVATENLKKLVEEFDR